MSAVAVRPRPADRVRAHRSLLGLALAMAGLVPVAAVGLVVDPRELVGAPVWAESLKFALSARRVPALRRESTRARLLRVGTGLYVGMLGPLTVQALMGQSIGRPGPAVLTAGVAMCTAAAVAAGVVVRAGRDSDPRGTAGQAGAVSLRGATLPS